jgi:hypothetical protein
MDLGFLNNKMSDVVETSETAETSKNFSDFLNMVPRATDFIFKL